LDKQNISEREADAISDETVGVLVPDEGVTQRPIRKRGYHRALKRKEPWAVNRLMWEDWSRLVAENWNNTYVAICSGTAKPETPPDESLP
jgi:hypothetical protein